MSVVYSSMEADVSKCGVYRYGLTRFWADKPTIVALPFVMLNPSTADAYKDDKTIRRCVGFARREGYGGILIVNLFGFRSKNPSDLLAANDPYGPENIEAINKVLSSCNLLGVPLVCAWGATKMAKTPAAFLKVKAAKANVKLLCLGKTNDGHPRHPLYLGNSAPLEPFA